MENHILKFVRNVLIVIVLNKLSIKKVYFFTSLFLKKAKRWYNTY